MHKLVFGLAAITVGVTGSALVSTASTPASAQELTELSIITANSQTCINYSQFVVPELGMDEDEGFKLNLLNSETTIPFVAFLDTGDAEFVMLDAAQVLQVANAGLPNSVVYEVFSYATEGVVVPAESEIRSLADLRDATIGLASDRDQITTIITMDSIGETLDSMNIETVVVGDVGPVLASALSSGEIDAFAGGSSDRAAINAAGLKIRNLTPVEVTNNPANNWVMADARMEEGFAGPFLRTWAMSQHAGQIDTHAIQSICRKIVPETFENPEVGAQLVYEQIYTYQVPRTKDFGELRPWIWESIQDPYVKLGELDAPIDTAEFLDDRFIEEANDYTTKRVYDYIQAWKQANPEALNW